ncbi:MAG: ribonuclease J [Pseudomonadota bacterium]
MALSELIAEQTGRVAVTTFASNVARVESVLLAAKAAGRSVCLVGRSMHKVTQAAKVAGLLSGLDDFVDEEEAGYIPPENILYLCTGSQGEPRAALGRIARGEHRHVTLGNGDTVIFSSRTIPGNEAGISQMQNQLADKGIRLITPKMLAEPIHVSGHPCRDELRRMYHWIKPQVSVPVHGERRHTLEHAEYARSLQVPMAVTPRNGDLVRLAPGKAAIVDTVPAGRLHLDGAYLVPAEAEGLKERRRMSRIGTVTVSVAIDKSGMAVDGPLCVARGFSEPDGGSADAFLDLLDEAAEAAYDKLKRRDRGDDNMVERELGRAVRRLCDRMIGRKPLVDVIVLRV